jgi:hypothetical protein
MVQPMSTGIVRRERYMRYQFPWRATGVAALALVATAFTGLFAMTAARAVSTAQTASTAPCVPVRVVVDPSRAPAPAAARQLVAEAASRVMAASGVPILVEDADGDAASDAVVVAWRPFPSTEPARIGLTSVSVDADGIAVEIQLNQDSQLPSDFSSRRSWGATLMHELGHVLGLAHSADAGDLMFSKMLAGAAEWGRGDLHALAITGAARGCEVPLP